MSYYGVISWDRQAGGDHLRIWESPKYATESEAVRATIAQRDTIPITGLRTVIIKVVDE